MLAILRYHCKRYDKMSITRHKRLLFMLVARNVVQCLCCCCAYSITYLHNGMQAALFTLAQFVTAFAWGAISDRIGRKVRSAFGSVLRSARDRPDGRARYEQCRASRVITIFAIQLHDASCNLWYEWNHVWGTLRMIAS